MVTPGNGDPWEWRPDTIYIVANLEERSDRLPRADRLLLGGWCKTIASWHRQTRDTNLLNALLDRKPMQSINYKFISDDLGAPRARSCSPIIEKRPGSHQLLPPFPQIDKYFGFPQIFRTSLRQFLVTSSEYLCRCFTD